MPRSTRPIFRFAAHRAVFGAILGALAATLALSGCGRKGPLDPPPASSQAQGQAGSGEAAGQSGAQAIEYGPDGRMLAPRGQKKKLPADWLID